MPSVRKLRECVWAARLRRYVYAVEAAGVARRAAAWVGELPLLAACFPERIGETERSHGGFERVCAGMWGCVVLGWVLVCDRV